MAGLNERLMEQIGLDAEKSAETIKVVADFIKEHAPESLHGMVDGVLGASSGDATSGDPSTGVFG